MGKEKFKGFRIVTAMLLLLSMFATMMGSTMVYASEGQVVDDEIVETQGSKSGNKKVTICHIPPGNPENTQTITVNENALQAHLDHGDYMGECVPPPPPPPPVPPQPADTPGESWSWEPAVCNPLGGGTVNGTHTTWTNTTYWDEASWSWLPKQVNEVSTTTTRLATDTECPAPPQPPDEHRTFVVDGSPVCETRSVEQITVTETAGYYKGDDGQWHLGGFFESGREVTDYRVMTYDEVVECAGPQPDPEFREVPSEPVPVCEDRTVNTTFTEESAGYYRGNDGEWHLGGFFPTGNSRVESRAMTADELIECAGPQPDPEFETKVVEVPVCEDRTVEVTTVTYSAGYYMGNDYEWHLGGFVEVERDVTHRDMTEDEIAECESGELKEVTPEAPWLVWTGVCGEEANVELPFVEGIEYHSERDGNIWHITAIALEGYAIAPDAQFEWELDVTPEECPEPGVFDVETATLDCSGLATITVVHPENANAQVVVYVYSGGVLPIEDLYITAEADKTVYIVQVDTKLWVPGEPVRLGVVVSGYEDGVSYTLDTTNCSEDPVEPVDPVDPTDPTDPVDPIDPVDPTDPVDPIDPVDPVDPVDPTDPVDPVELTDPEPVDPVDPAPVDPVDPAPVDPVDPDPVTPAPSDDGDGGKTEPVNGMPNTGAGSAGNGFALSAAVTLVGLLGAAGASVRRYARS